LAIALATAIVPLATLLLAHLIQWTEAQAAF
jgi:hypothetical protein